MESGNKASAGRSFSLEIGLVVNRVKVLPRRKKQYLANWDPMHEVCAQAENLTYENSKNKRRFRKRLPIKMSAPPQPKSCWIHRKTCVRLISINRAELFNQEIGYQQYVSGVVTSGLSLGYLCEVDVCAFSWLRHSSGPSQTL